MADYADEMLWAADRAERSVEEAYEALQTAKTRFDIEAIKFAALRDEAVAYYSMNPYLHLESKAFWGEPRKNRGRFRFLRMPTADAVRLALAESTDPASPAQLLTRIRQGGGEWVDPRGLNAALQGLVNQSEVVRIEPDGEDKPALYQIKEQEEGIDPDDLPF